MTKILSGLDCWGVPSGASCKAAGIGAVNGYIPYPGSASKTITEAMLEDLTNNGIYVWLTWEVTANAPENGAAQAVKDAEQAVAGVESLKLPVKTNVAIYSTNDSVVTNWAAVEAYFEKWATLIAAAGYQPGVYADDTVCNVLVQHKIPITRFWQTGAGSSTVLPWAQLYQYGPSGQFQLDGRTCDKDDVQLANFGGVNLHGLWTPPAPPKPPVPKPVPKPAPETPAAHAYAVAHGFVQIDHAEANLANQSHPHIEWYVWKKPNGPMVGEPINLINETSIIYALASVLNAAGIPHAGA